jgi:rod shape determining protein RodA
MWFGHGAMGAQRWLDVGFMRLQPSEIIKFIVPVTIAWFLTLTPLPPRASHIVIAAIIIFIPAIMVAKQPDLGTAIIVGVSGIFVLFLAGISWKLIILTIISALGAIPIMWQYVLLDYQKNRLISLFNPEHDALGAGWNIIQSKIAVGSGGITGKGWLEGTQSHLNFLPESHTDFIIAVLAEELGLVGILILLMLYSIIIIRALTIAVHADNSFNRLLSGSIIMIFFTYIFINIGMVTGILPVVGIPLPLFSYGGSSMVSIMLSLGLLMSIHSHKQLLPQ